MNFLTTEMNSRQVMLLGVVLVHVSTVLSQDEPLFCSPTCPCQCDAETSTIDCSKRGFVFINDTKMCGSPLEEFQTLNFSGNILKEFPLMYFRSLRVTVDVSYNEIESLTDSFRILPDADVHLNYSNNKIQYYGRMHSFHEIVSPSSSGYLLSSIEIDLSNNRLVQFSFEPLMSSSNTSFSLILRNNSISSISVRITTDVDVFLDFSNNMITNLRPSSITTERPLTRQLGVNLSGNPWSCDCRQKWIAETNSSLRFILNTTESVQPICMEPERLQHRPLLSLTRDELTCDPQLNATVPLVIHAEVGADVKIECPFHSFITPINEIKWVITHNGGDGKPSASRLVLEGAVDRPLLVENMSREWEGTYRCTVSNGEGDWSEDLTVRISSPASTTIPMASHTVTVTQPSRPVAGIVVLLLLVIAETIALAILGIWCLRYQRDRKPAGVATDPTAVLGSLGYVTYHPPVANDEVASEAEDPGLSPNGPERDMGNQRFEASEHRYENSRIINGAKLKPKMESGGEEAVPHPEPPTENEAAGDPRETYYSVPGEQKGDSEVNQEETDHEYAKPEDPDGGYSEPDLETERNEPQYLAIGE